MFVHFLYLIKDRAKVGGAQAPLPLPWLRSYLSLPLKVLYLRVRSLKFRVHVQVTFDNK